MRLSLLLFMISHQGNNNKVKHERRLRQPARSSSATTRTAIVSAVNGSFASPDLDGTGQDDADLSCVTYSIRVDDDKDDDDEDDDDLCSRCRRFGSPNEKRFCVAI